MAMISSLDFLKMESIVPFRIFALVFVILLGNFDIADGNLSCYDCEAEFRKNNNPNNNYSCIYNVNNTYTPRQCQSHETMCKTYTERVNRVIRTYRRNCAEASRCVNACETRGLGVDRQQCTTCCGTDGCNSANVGSRSQDWNLVVKLAAVMTAYTASCF